MDTDEQYHQSIFGGTGQLTIKFLNIICIVDATESGRRGPLV